MNNEKTKRSLKRKLHRLETLKLCLQSAVRSLTDEIICVNEELALVEGGKSSIKAKKTFDISDYTSKFYAEFEKAKQNS